MLDFKDQHVRDQFESYFGKAISRILPWAIRDAFKEMNMGNRQEFIPIKQACLNYGLSRKTLYNCHKKGFITLRTTEGKTYVSVFEIEDHIRNNPVRRNPL